MEVRHVMKEMLKHHHSSWVLYTGKSNDQEESRDEGATPNIVRRLYYRCYFLCLQSLTHTYVHETVFWIRSFSGSPFRITL